MKVLWVYIPVSSQIEFCNGKIYDRNEDADQDVSTSADLVANISNRKSATYIERKIFPYATEDDLCMELIGRARQMAVNKKQGSSLEKYDGYGTFEKCRTL